eukprot:m.37214 g.37214  ORF g.37214 m.37214 type:complete len:224 (-) comp44952_c0_seq2:478-1149(-)
MSSDSAVRATNDDAAFCKRSAVTKGYWSDAYVAAFTSGWDRRSKPPLVHRGYFARVKALDIVVKQFVGLAGARSQILNLGAGFDTLFWRLSDEGVPFGKIVDIDMPEVIQTKKRIIESSKSLQKHLTEEANRSRYILVEADLRNLSALREKLEVAQIDVSAPTLVISECVLIYLPPDLSRGVLTWVAETFSTSFCVIYEQVRPTNRFLSFTFALPTSCFHPSL